MHIKVNTHTSVAYDARTQTHTHTHTHTYSRLLPMVPRARQKRPTIEAKETYYRGKRDLL